MCRIGETGTKNSQWRPIPENVGKQYPYFSSLSLPSFPLPFHFLHSIPHLFRILSPFVRPHSYSKIWRSQDNTIKTHLTFGTYLLRKRHWETYTVLAYNREGRMHEFPRGAEEGVQGTEVHCGVREKAPVARRSGESISGVEAKKVKLKVNDPCRKFWI